MRILVTGHTGFKGGWLSLLLKELGHEVYGVAQAPDNDSLFSKAGISQILDGDFRVDIRDAQEFTKVLRQVKPAVVIHLAAQALVVKSYSEPVSTFDTNVNGTINLLEAARGLPCIEAMLVVTTDKVYDVKNGNCEFRESDSLGGHDPYSASKAMADIATQSYSRSFPFAPVGIARAGNVIGGGDVTKGRLLPDIIEAFGRSSGPQLRYPDAVRPWQHVLDCLFGYLLSLERIIRSKESDIWNFGPDPLSQVKVSKMVEDALEYLGLDTSWTAEPGEHPVETLTLTLDSSKARTELDWSDLLPYPRSLYWTLEWHTRTMEEDAHLEITLSQIREYLKVARQRHPLAFAEGRILRSPAS